MHVTCMKDWLQLNKMNQLPMFLGKMSEIEKSHAIAFFNKLKPNNDGILPAPSGRAKTLNLIGKVFGYDYVLGMLMDTEKSISTAIISTKNKNNIPLTGTEANHVKILRTLLEEENKVKVKSLQNLKVSIVLLVEMHSELPFWVEMMAWFQILVW